MGDSSSWAQLYSACVSCGTTEREHEAHGLCIRCSKREYGRSHKQECSLCGKINRIARRDDEKRPICQSCNKRYFCKVIKKQCDLCSCIRRIDTTDNGKLVCNVCYKRHYQKLREIVCAECNKLKTIEAVKDGKELCRYCYSKAYRQNNKKICERCGKPGNITKNFKEHGKVCQPCYKQIRTLYYRALELKRKSGDKGNLSEIDLEYIKARDKTCVYCGSNEKISFDHIVPLSKGGHSTIENLALACLKCNLSKNAQDAFKWCELKGISIPKVVLESRPRFIAEAEN